MVIQLAVRLRYAVALAGRYPLLAGADLDVATGEILVLKGANGAGKTSLLRVVAGLLPLSAGDATVLGLDPTCDARHLRRQVGLLGHANGLYDDLTAEENVRFAARAGRLPREAAPMPLSASASGTGFFPCLPGGSQPASAGGWLWPPCWPAGLNCGCSMNPTPALTPNTVNFWTAY